MTVTRVLMLSWEYPPVSVGGLARHVHSLSRELARLGHRVEVVTQGSDVGTGTGDGAGVQEVDVGEGVLRVWRRNAYPLASPDFLHWVHQLNYGLLEGIMGLAAARNGGPSGAPFDVIHAHDWLVAFAARAAKHAYRVPLVATIHATEAGRQEGIHNPWQRYISEVEWWLTYEAWRVVCCSAYMEAELSGQFQLPTDKIRVIPNGVDAGEAETEAGGGARPAPRERFAQPGEDIVCFVGRLVREKGVDTLLDAAPAILDAHPAARLVISGTGPHESHLRERVAAMGLGGRVTLTGYLDDRARDLLYRSASVVVVPSYYEPFGLTALEAMAAGAPVIVSDTGGLAETVAHGETGLKVRPADPAGLAGAILHLLTDKPLARRLARQARVAVLREYSWAGVARETGRVYEEVALEAAAGGWTPERAVSGGEDWDEARRRTRAMTRGLEPIGRYNPS